MRFDRNTASEIECVTKTTVLLVCCHKPQQLLVQMVARDFVERAERFVHQQQFGFEGERARDRHALLHAAGQLPRKFALEPVQADHRQILGGAGLALLGAACR